MIDTPIIVAFDTPDLDSASKLASQLDPKLCRAKVGKELFTAEGIAVIEMLHEKHYEIFLDLKFHDIPNTVAGAVRAAARRGVWMCNVHASGGCKMLGAAKEALDEINSEMKLIAVTVLTSSSEIELEQAGINRSLEDQVYSLARMTKEQGLDGVVCSAQEAVMLRERIGNEFLLVTPGVRLEPANDDQHRICTPKQAIENGSSYLVIGRPITQATAPLKALEDILKTL